MPIELEECTSKLGPLYSLSCTHCPLKCYNCLRMCSLYISMADARRFQSGDQMVHLQPRSSPSQTAKCSLPLFDVSWSAISEVRVGLGLRWGQKRGSDRRNAMRRITKLPGKWWGMTIVFPRTFWLGARREPYHGWKKPILVGVRVLALHITQLNHPSTLCSISRGFVVGERCFLTSAIASYRNCHDSCSHQCTNGNLKQCRWEMFDFSGCADIMRFYFDVKLFKGT